MVRFAGFCLLLLCSWYQVCTGNPFMAAKVALQGAIQLYQGIQKIQGLGNDMKTESEQITVVELQIYKKLDQLSTDFQDLRNTIITKISNELKDKLTEKSDELFKYIKDVQRFYKRFLNFVTYADEYESTEIQDFSDVATTASLVELPTTIEKMHEALVDLDIKQESLISIIAKNSTPSDTMCIRHQSKQQLIHDLYEAVILTDTKGLLITLYALNIKAKYQNRTYEFRKTKEIDNFYYRTLNTFINVKEALRISSREVWKCDPPQHVKGVTYDKLQEIFQGFFMWEPDTTNSAWNAAFYTCASIKDERLRCRSAPCQAQPSERRCTGHLRDCQSIASWMQVCHSPKGSDRRYDWMRTDSDIYYGRYYEHCHNTQGLNSIWPIENCLCNCESENREGDRYFSLLDALADVEENKVVTGVKLTKDNHIFHIQIQQGILGVNGTIINEPTWKNITRISKSQLLADEVSTHHFVVKSYPHQNDDRELKYDEWVEFYKNDLVYAVTYTQNNIYLDTLDSNPNVLLTGLRFQHVGNSLKLEIQTTPFDYATGQLQTNASSWKSNNNNVYARQELTLTEPDDPSKSTRSDLVSSHNEFIHFRMSDLKRDLGQYTIPFIDIQEVTTNPPLPLSGAGIFHKGSTYSGGFLGLKVIHYDYTDHL